MNRAGTIEAVDRTAVSVRAPAVAVAGAALTFLLVRRWVQLGEFVPGLDQGNWLAFGHALLGEETALPEWMPLLTVPPLVPLLLTVIEKVSDPMTASRTVALLSVAAVFLGMYLVAVRNGLPVTIATVAASLLSVSSAVIEPMAFGGYPQNFAFAGLLVATSFASRFLDTARGRDLWGVGAGLLLASISHHMYFLLAVAGVGTAWLLWMAQRQPTARVAAATAGGLAASSILPLALFLPTAIALLGSSYAPPINASDASYAASVRYVFPDPTWLWLAVIGTGVAHLIARTSHGYVADRTVLALVFLSIVPWALTAEARLLPPLVAGGLIGVGLMVHGSPAGISGTNLVRPIQILAVAAAAALIVVSDRRADIAINYFHAADRSLIESAIWLEEHADGPVAVRQDYRGWPVGWWYRGLAGGDYLVGSDDRWVAFAEEVDDARTARALFAATTAEEARSIAAAHGITMAVTRKWDWIGWRRWTDSPDPIRIVYDDGTRIVLELRAR